MTAPSAGRERGEIKMSSVSDCILYHIRYSPKTHTYTGRAIEGVDVVTEDSVALMETQRAREALSMSEGYARFDKNQERLKKNEGTYATYESAKVIKGCIPLVTLEIERYLEIANNGGKGKTPVALSILSSFEPEKLAYMGLNSVFNGLGAQADVRKTTIFAGRMVHSEHVALKLQRERDRKIAERIGKQLASQGSSKNRSKAFRRLVEDQDIEIEDWPSDLLVKVGEPLVNAVLSALPDIFSLITVTTGRKATSSIIEVTEEGAKLLRDVREAAAWMRPVLTPMVVEPRPWESFNTGCYYDERLARTVPLMRTSQKDHRHLIKQAIGSGQMDFVLEALNAIQGTRWAINGPVLDAVQWAWENEVPVEGLPRRSRIPLPGKRDPDEWEAMTPKQRKGVKIVAAKVHVKNRAIDADVQLANGDLSTARELLDYECFYLPCNIDFRGRVYPVCHFNNQRSDHIKALFQFADGKPLGPNGGRWLAIHLANCGDVDKISKKPFEEREQWVLDNEEMIVAIAQDPKATVADWSQADAPFMFLAACIEYAAWRSSGYSEGFVSHLPIALDGSNSGLQHYSAALRSEEEARLVCLTDEPYPHDAYQTVANAANAMVKRDAEAGDLRAIRLLEMGGLNRSLAKRNVMTFAYSSEKFGFGQQQMTDTMGPLNDKVLRGEASSNPYELPVLDPKSKKHGEPDSGYQVSFYIASKVWDAVREVVTKASEGMTFFKKVAEALASEGKPVCWVTPLGLPVLHKYTEWDVKTVELFLFDRSVPIVEARLKDKVDPEERGVLKRVVANIRTGPKQRIDATRARNAMAPNVIHSMDASHLMLTVLSAKEEGIANFSLIHDSFGTHAGSTDRFFQIIREAFVDMYESYCPFEEVLEQAMVRIDDETKLPSLPAIGDWELREVLDATYAFA